MMPNMRTTVRLDDDIFDRLKAQARKENVSLTRIVNRALKAGLRADAAGRRAQPAFREHVFSMGTPRLALDKALALSSALEDEEIVRELAAGR